MEDPHVKAGEVVSRKTRSHGILRRRPIHHQGRPEQFCCTSRIRFPLPARDLRNQTAARLWFPLQTLQTSICQTVFPPCSHLRCRTRTPPIFISSSCCPACSLSHVYTPAFPTPSSLYALTNNDWFSLSDLFSLGSRPDRPDRPAHCSHLTIRTGNQPALRVGSQNDSGCPCQPAPLLPAQNRWPPAPTQPTDGQTAPGRDPTVSAATTHVQQTVNNPEHEAEQFTLKAGPVIQGDVHCTAQPMRTAPHTVRDPDWAV